MNLKITLAALAMMTCGVANAQYQLANGGFEGDWESCVPFVSGKTMAPAVGTQPKGWNVANVAGYYLNLGVTGMWTGKTVVASKIDNGHTGKAIKMANTNTLNNIIPGYMSLGTPWNTANTSGKNGDGGTFGGIAFTSHPDALEFYYMRSVAKSENKQPASVVAYIWKGTTTQTNVPANVANTASTVTMINRDANVLNRAYALGDKPSYSSDFSLIATIGENKTDAEVIISDTTLVWKKMVCEFTYHSDETPEMMNIIFGAFENYAGKENNEDGNSLSVDDVKFLYYSELKSATFNGSPISFTGTSASVNAPYDESKLALTSNGKAATIEKNYDAASAKLYITVKGEDFSVNSSNYHTYTIQFAKPATKPTVGTLAKTIKAGTSTKQQIDNMAKEIIEKK